VTLVTLYALRSKALNRRVRKEQPRRTQRKAKRASLPEKPILARPERRKCKYRRNLLGLTSVPTIT